MTEKLDDSNLTPEQRARKANNEAKRLAKLQKFAAKQEKAKQQPKASAPKESKPAKETVKKEADPVIETPAGEKKRLSSEMESSYSPASVEKSWYSWWQKEGFMKPEIVEKYQHIKGTFVIPIPPPNVTGSLHLGHALTIAVEDCLIRWKRMNGYQALYVPGSDHAGIATQAVVEKQLMKTKGLSRHDLGREKFIEEIWKWREVYGTAIYDQVKRLGASVDWDRACFTLDPKMNDAVVEVFVKLYEEGLIYRDNRLVNWSGALQTALSDLEVEHKEIDAPLMKKVDGKEFEFGFMTYFYYEVDDEEHSRIAVATTRPETILGDTAVAVHPKDARYTKYHGKMLIHPFMNRKIPLIVDDEVEMELGSGAVKITPAHDFEDFKKGKRHNLGFINILTDDNKLNDEGGQFKGLSRFEARIKVVEELRKKGLFIKNEPHKMKLPICSRSSDIIEPRLKPQWWLNCNDMASRAAKGVKDGEISVFPKEYERDLFRWTDDIRDWCLSRQLWWGHRVPAYRIMVEGLKPESDLDNKFWVCGRNYEEVFEKAQKKFPGKNIKLEQDHDVLDTWFSSALWPFSTLGWPKETNDMAKYYPTTLLETGKDILFFWVIRMIMMGYKFTGKPPFKNVYLHPMVRDAHGRKMSKSLGNVIDPIDVIQGITLENLHKKLLVGNLAKDEIIKATEGQKKDFPNGIPECGTDALRFALCTYLAQGKDINLDVLRIEGYRKFCNKLWNSCKFILMKIGDDFQPSENAISTLSLNVIDKWILTKLNQCIVDTNKGFEEYNFMMATSSVYSFWLYNVCDVYIEVSKAIIGSEASIESQEAVKNTLFLCLKTALQLLHPFMPFITEELYQRIYFNRKMEIPTISLTPYPVQDASFNYPVDTAIVESAIQIVHGMRSLISDYNIKKNATFYVKAFNDKQSLEIENEALTIKSLVKGLNELTVLKPTDSAPKGCALVNIGDYCTIYLLVKGMVDIEEEKSKINAKLEKVKANIVNIQKIMTSDGYEAGCNEKVKESNKKKYGELELEISILTKALENFMSIEQ